MHLSEILKLAAGALSANKLRSGLTMLGIAVGVFSVIGVMTVISGLRSNIEQGLNVRDVEKLGQDDTKASTGKAPRAKAD